MKKYAVVVLSLMCCFNISFAMSDEWLAECSSTHRTFRSFVEEFNYDRDPQKTIGDIKHLERVHNGLSNELIKHIVPLDSTLSLEAKDAFFTKYRQLLCVPWLCPSEAQRIVQPVCNNTMEKREDKKSLLWLVTNTQSSFITMLLPIASFFHVRFCNCPYNESSRWPFPTPVFRSNEELVQYDKHLLPLQALLLTQGACVSGPDYKILSDGEVKQRPGHIFSRINVLSPELVALILQREGKDLVNKKCCFDDNVNTYISKGPLTPLAHAFKDGDHDFSFLRSFPAIRVLLENGARLDVDGAQGAFPAFVESFIKECVRAQENIPGRDGESTELKAREMQLQESVSEVGVFIQQLVAEHSISAQDLTSAQKIISERLKSPNCTYKAVWEDINHTIQARKKRSVQRFVGAPKRGSGRNKSTDQVCATS